MKHHRVVIVLVALGLAGLLWTITATQAREPAAEPAFTKRFGVDKRELTSKGRNPFFVLEPGFVLVLEGKDDGKPKRLTITVLDETKLVDGVETRVVEELETSGGKVLERSRNYYAISTRTNDVYYFGEDTGGAWESGKQGARFGLMMPGTPLLGARHYQELAPKVAMDRAEVKSLSGTLVTPAKRFTDCLVVEETSDVEPGHRETKLYARGVGLILDEGLKLVRYGHPKRKKAKTYH